MADYMAFEHNNLFNGTRRCLFWEPGLSNVVCCSVTAAIMPGKCIIEQVENPHKT